MIYPRILPAAAASIIALTATIAFAGEQRGAEEVDFFRIRVGMRDSTDHADDINANALPVTIKSKTGQIYRVEIERGHKTRVVTIDAYTGRILGSKELQVIKS